MDFLSKKLLLLTLITAVMIGCSPAPKETKSISEMNDEELTALADSLAHKYILVDGHVDLPYRMTKKGFMITKTVEDVSVETTGNFDYPKSKRGGLDAPFMSIYVPSSYQEGGAKEFADSLIDMVSRIPVVFPEMFALANTPADVIVAFEQGLVALPMGMENGAPIEDDINNVKYFYDRGIRYITLTHSKDNQICDSSYDETEDTWNGISPFGEQVVAEMNKWGIMVDISHVTDSAAFDALRLTKAPVIASHSSCRKFTPDFHRNMSDTLIRALAANDGVIHINFGSTFLSKESQDKFDKMQEDLINYRAENELSTEDSAYTEYAKQYAIDNDVYEDVQKVADHIDHVVSLVGINHVGFGSDYDGVGDSLPKGMKDVSTYPNLIKELLKRGYTPGEIEKICSKNTFRVWRKVKEVAQELQSGV